MARPGYVYVLSNQSMPGIVKIGRSIHGGKSRARDLYQTGVPTPFTLEFEVMVGDPVEVEDEVHARLEQRGLRVSGSREFFSIAPEEAKVSLLEAVVYRIGDGQYILDQDAFDAWAAIGIRAQNSRFTPEEIRGAINHITDEQLEQAVRAERKRKLKNRTMLMGA